MPAPRRACLILALAVTLLAAGPAARLAPPAWALEDPPPLTSTWDPTVPPLRVTISAAAHAPMPTGAALVLQGHDDAPQHRRIMASLEETLAVVGGRGAAPTPLDLSYSLYVIPAGAPPKAAAVMGALEPRPIHHTRGISATRQAGARWGQPEGLPRGIPVTDLRGRGAPHGLVLSQDRSAFGAVLRLELLVRDQRDGTPLWSGWADSTTRGLRRDQVVALVAEHVLATLGQTVVGREITVPVPAALGGTAPAE
ncbi:hypothetical protein [Roseospira visakhapatnamensis]|uniref:DUF4136 domain-containing protein n=1 Tax=Roseospira visakhapatnamensis TaxID=390880 RepID=A0A7W6W9Z5_9PROT|nr:hypothetical protein [Roseospira visakhapatnamensis]MBB4266328.1 hypothetical protein [Roseospira visakhapatnamensis]